MLKLQVIGNLGNDCTTNAVNGKNVINFSVAHTEKYKDAQGTQQEKTTWVDCSYWTEKTGIATYLTKGKQVYVEGTPEVRTFTRKDGTTAAVLGLRVFNVQLLGGAGNAIKNAAPAQQQQSAPAQQQSATIENTDDFPF